MGSSLKKARLPAGQLLILAFCRVAEPLAFTSVFPYLPEMVESFDVPADHAAKWAGIITAVFSLSQACTGLAYGRASDVFGRKPVIMAGLVCTIASTILFGFSRSLVWAIVTRALSGASNGNVGIIRTMVAELVPEKELQPIAFSISPMILTLGNIFGPAFGGALADPVVGEGSILREFPYALPNIVAAIIFAAALVVGVLFGKETLETKKNERDRGRVVGSMLTSLFSKKKGPQPKCQLDDEQEALLNRPNGSEPNQDDKQQAPPAITYSELFSRQTNLNLIAYTMLFLHSIAFDQLLPIFMHYPRQLDRATNPDVELPFKFTGGFGIGSSRIGLLFMVYGLFGIFFQFIIFPPAARRFGILKCFKACSVTFPIIYVLTPFTALLPSVGTQQAAMVVLMLVKCWAAIFGFPSSTIMLTNSAVSLRVLGTLNGVATSLSALGRAAGPAVGGLTFSLGVSKGYVILPWWVLAALAILSAIPVFFLEEQDGFSDSKITELVDEDTANDAVLSSSDRDVRQTSLYGTMSSSRNHVHNLHDSYLLEDDDVDDFMLDDSSSTLSTEDSSGSSTASSQAPTVNESRVQ